MSEEEFNDEGCKYCHIAWYEIKSEGSPCGIDGCEVYICCDKMWEDHKKICHPKEVNNVNIMEKIKTCATCRDFGCNKYIDMLFGFRFNKFVTVDFELAVHEIEKCWTPKQSDLDLVELWIDDHKRKSSFIGYNAFYDIDYFELKKEIERIRLKQIINEKE